MQPINLRIPELKPIIEKIEEELLQAREKFPSNVHMLHAMTEESGEVVKAMLDQHHANHDMEKDPIYIQQMGKHVRKELIQTIAMCIRVYEEGDSSFPYNPDRYTQEK